MRKTVIKLFGPDEDNKFYEYFEGYCDTSEVEDLPTELVADGSNVIDTKEGDWYFFNENEKVWDPKLNIQG